MTDLLIKLYDLPDVAPYAAAAAKRQIVLRRARAYEKSRIVKWVQLQFGRGWADECEAAFCRQPVCCFIAASESGIAGFACYDCTCRDFFGPIGVLEGVRGRGVGTALFLRSLHAMAEAGYAYAVVGDGEAALEFYSRVVPVQTIAGSSPGFYADRLNLPDG